MHINSVGSTGTLMELYAQRNAARIPAKAGPADTVEDSLEVSEGAQRLGWVQRFMDGAGEDGKITMDEIRAFHNRHAEKSKVRFKEVLRELGLDPKQKLEITRDPYSRFHVQGAALAPSDQVRLEQALSEDTVFQHSYAAADGTGCLIASAEASVPFHEAYRRDPKAALARYGWLIGANWESTFVYENGEGAFKVAHGA